MKYIFIMFVALFINSFSTSLFAQQTATGKTAGKKGTTNFTTIATFEKANPGKIMQRKITP